MKTQTFKLRFPQTFYTKKSTRYVVSGSPVFVKQNTVFTVITGDGCKFFGSVTVGARTLYAWLYIEQLLRLRNNP